MTSTTSSIHFPHLPRHPLNVRPSGNQIILSDTKRQSLYRQWQRNLGHLSILSDELLFRIISQITEPKDLVRLGQASRVLYAFTYYDDLWKQLFLSAGTAQDIDWKGSWRKTVLHIDDAQEAKVQCSENLVCLDLLFRPFQCSQIDYRYVFKKIISAEWESYQKGIDVKVGHMYGVKYTPVRRIAEQSISLERFEQELIDTPFIITNRKEQDTRWPRWTLSSLLERFPQVRFQQEAVNWSLEAYSRYLDQNDDESPLYLFDCNSTAIKQLAQEYTVPEIFQKDLFKVFNEGELESRGSLQGEANNVTINCRPNFRWLIVGSARTGSTFHKDPNSTCAWNAVLSGCKLWIMAPPNMVPPGVDTNADESEVTSPVSLSEYVLSGFFSDVLRLSEDQENQVMIGITFPGECNFVPDGWWHLVINIDDTVALTQNFISAATLPKVLSFFQNKPDQVSGFRLQKLDDAISVVHERIKDIKSDDERFLERRAAIKAYYDSFVGSESIVDGQKSIINDDDECISSFPLLEMFEELLVEHGYQDTLIEARQKLAEAVSRKHKASAVVQQNQLWDSVVYREEAVQKEGTGNGESAGNGFSFNFGFDGDEFDEDGGIETDV